MREQNLPAVIVNPSTPVGPRDIKPTPTGQMILDCAAGRMPAYVDTGVNIVHVDDVAEGHALALERGRIGEKYILGGENYLLRDLFAMVSEIAHAPAQDQPAAGGYLAGGYCVRMAVPRFWLLAPCHAGDARHVPQENVLLLRKSHERAGLCPAPRPHGGGRRHYMVPQ